jgi:hypothetical protein
MVYWSWSRRYAGGMPLDSCSPTSMTGAARRHVMPPDCRRPLVSSLVLSLAARKRLKMPSRPAGMDERIGRPVGAQSLAASGQAPIAAHPDRIVAFGAAAPGTLSPEPREAGVEPPAALARISTLPDALLEDAHSPGVLIRSDSCRNRWRWPAESGLVSSGGIRKCQGHKRTVTV